MATPGKFGICVVEGEGRLVYFLAQFWDPLLYVESFALVFEKSAKSDVISRLTMDPAGDESLRIIDRTSLADMKER